MRPPRSKNRSMQVGKAILLLIALAHILANVNNRDGKMRNLKRRYSFVIATSTSSRTIYWHLAF
ncbi:hypothetical protein DSM107007_49410 [Nostoc sp. PCC 7120 = FACHB-418]|nr:hypothetical protein DSM107007_49410 [Nostoc sp. PCC 7120 = FACHB-418]